MVAVFSWPDVKQGERHAGKLVLIELFCVAKRNEHVLFLHFLHLLDVDLEQFFLEFFKFFWPILGSKVFAALVTVRVLPVAHFGDRALGIGVKPQYPRRFFEVFDGHGVVVFVATSEMEQLANDFLNDLVNVVFVMGPQNLE